MTETRIKFGFIGILIVAALLLTGSINAFASNKNQEDTSKILSAIDSYQENYFTIIKRNDVLLDWEDSSKLNKDRRELKKLFNKVEIGDGFYNDGSFIQHFIYAYITFPSRSHRPGRESFFIIRQSFFQ